MVDLICADENGVPFHATSDCVFDCAWGSGENDFELTLYDGTVLPDRGLVYVDGTEVGGIVDHMKDELSDGVSVVTYSGRSWHGMLAGKVLQPDSGQDYLKASGPVNQVLSNLLARIGLSDVFKVRADSTKTIPMFQFDRYCTAYDGIRRMLAANDLKLMFQEIDGTIWMYAQPVVAHDDTVDSDLVDFSITKDYRRTNHMIGLGKGDLRNRLVVHYYADGSGKVSNTRTFGGRDEIAAVYDYSSAEKNELDKQTKKQLQDLQGAGAVDVTVHDGLSLDVGDRVAGCDHVTGLTVTAVVLKKIVKLSGGLLSVSYEVGDTASSKTEYSNYTSSSSSSGSTGGGVSLEAGRGLSISGGTINAEVASEDLDSVRQVAESANRTASGFEAQIGKANQTAEDARNVASGLNESIGKANTTANAAKDSADQARSLASERVKTITAVAPLSASRNGDTVALSAPNTLPAPTSLTSTDLDTLKSDYGAYWADGGNTCANKPTGVGHFGLIVQRTALGWTTQILTDPQTGKIWRRTWNSNSWDEWKALAEDRDATTTIHGLMSIADKQKLDSIQDGANAYTLPVASSGTLGGVKPDGTTIHITADGTISAANLTGAEASFLTAHPVGSIIMLREGIDPARWGGEWRELPSTGACVWERIN